MKTYKYISLVFALLVTAISCTDDGDKTIYNPNNAKAGELLAVNGSYELEATEAKNAMETFKWGAMDAGYQAAITYTLEADLVGEEFKNVQIVDQIASKTQMSITVGKMNSAMIKLLDLYELDIENPQPQTVELRIKGSISDVATPLYSNVITSTITAFPDDVEYPALRVVGDYCGWGHDKANKLFDFDGDGVYQAWVKLDGKGINGFKISGGVTDWDNDRGNWGLKEGETLGSKEPASIALWNEGSSKNILAYEQKYYKFTFDKATETLTKENSMNSFGIVGDAAPNGWDGPDYEMEFNQEKQLFTALVELKVGEIKLRGDNTWGSVNLGGSNGKLSEGGDNIKIETAGTYRITVKLNDPTAMTYTLKAAEALNPDLIKPAVLSEIKGGDIAASKSINFDWKALDFGEQESATVRYEVEMDLAGAKFTNAQVIAKTTELNTSLSGTDLLAVLQKLDANVALGIEKEIEVQVVAYVTGLDDPFVSNIGKATVKVVEDPKHPTELYMIGEEFGDWNWGNEQIVELTPVNGKAGSFWTIKYFTADKPFKWNSKKDWGGDFNGKGTNEGFELDGGNAVVKTSGLYLVYIDLDNDIIKLETPQVFGMGDAFGSWDMGAHPMKLEGDKMTITTLANLDGEKELRLYANSSISTIGGDWWRMEFIILDGKIEYRGNGGDQARVHVSAGQKVTLNFANNTGSIE